jgi:hypothetical protein
MIGVLWWCRFAIFEDASAEAKHVISDVVLKFVPFFLLYTEFANHHVSTYPYLLTHSPSLLTQHLCCAVLCPKHPQRMTPTNC